MSEKCLSISRAPLFLSLVVLILSSQGLAGDRSKDEGALYPNIVRPTVEFGMYGIGPGQLMAPLSASLDSEGRIYVADCGNHQVQVFGNDGQVLLTFGEFGRGSGEFNCPSGVDVSGETVVVVDKGNSRIQIFDTGGNYRSQFGQFGSSEDALSLPEAVAVSGSKVFVANTGADRIQVYELDGQFLFGFGGPGVADGRFSRPSGVAVDEAGNIYVADTNNNRIQSFDGRGKFLRSWGSLGSFDGEFAGPSDIAFARGEIYVADAVNHRIQVFSPDGSFLYQSGRHPTVPHQGDGRLHYPLVVAAHEETAAVVVCEKFESRCQVFDTGEARRNYVAVNSTAWWEKYPFFHYRSPAITTTQPDGSEYLLTAEEELHRVTVVSISPTENPHGVTGVMQLGEFGAGPGEFKAPQGIAMDSQGRIWVSDTGNDRLQVFDRAGNFLRVIGNHGSGPGEFNEPGSIVIDSKGRVYVADAGNHRIVVLDSKGQFLDDWGQPAEEVTNPANGDLHAYHSKPLADGELNHPLYAVMDPSESRLYVLDMSPRVQVFDTSGQFLFAFGEYGTGPGQFFPPMKLGIGPDGMVYVSDGNLNRISKFDAEGNYIMSWGRHGLGPGEFYLPQGVAVDSENHVWVIDYGNHRGQVFTADGDFLYFFGEDFIGNPDFVGWPSGAEAAEGPRQ